MVGRTPVLRPDRRHALPPLVRRRQLRRPGRRSTPTSTRSGTPSRPAAARPARPTSACCRPGTPSCSTDHRDVLRQRPDLLHPQRPELAVLALVLPRQRHHRRRREHRRPAATSPGAAPRACSSTAATCTSSARPTASCSRSAFVNGAPTGTSTVADTDAPTGAARRCSSPRCCRTSRRPPPSPRTAPASPAPSTRPARATATAAIQSYEWTFSDGDEAGGPNPQKDFAATGTYDVTLTVTDDGGLTSLGDPAGLGRQAERAADRGLHHDVRLPRLRLRRQHVGRHRRHDRRLRVGLR